MDWEAQADLRGGKRTRRRVKYRLLAKVLVLGALAAWPLSVALGAGLDYLRELPGCFAATDSLAVQRKAEWVTPALEADLLARGRLPGSHSLFDPETFARLRAAFLASPWVKDAAVWRDLPRDLGVRLTLRRPTAYVVRAEGPAVLVDADGVRLPDDFYPREKNILALPDLVGILGEPPAPGGVWANPDLAEGLFLARRVLSSPVLKEWGVRAVRFRREAAQVRIELALAGGGRTVRWGSPRGAPREGEPSWQDKLKKLEEFAGRRQPFEEICLDQEDAWFRKPPGQ